ncbi:glycoside hydrolase family 5 protein [Allorhizobium terrae]|uniref:Glycoside hydrolase family 5 protein n=2 Tax=Allorhizobium terrae TaxID=1848972 RepID=A0A4S3ZNM7_9HYPH|nr:glycoside hydrolase family 5 protein [Allorhizobium terrae]
MPMATNKKTRLTYSLHCMMVGGAALALSVLPVQAGQGCFRGINLSGAEFGKLGGVVNKDYTYPSDATIQYFAEKGFTSVRLPFKWERLQADAMGALNADELKLLDDAVSRIKEAGMNVVLDPHNFAQYKGKFLNTPEVPVDVLADFWGKLASHYANDPAIVFGLMNEPFDMPATQWLPVANAAIAAIRKAGAKNLVLVPGVAWTGAHSWQSERPGGANSVVMLGVKDSANNYAYEVHQYFDADYSGTKAECSGAAGAIAGVENVTKWLRANGKRGYLGEFGAAGDPACVKAIKEMTGVVEANRDLWVGWAYWVAGDWWSPKEPLNIQPGPSGDRPQLAGLKPFLMDFSASSSTCPALDKF